MSEAISEHATPPDRRVIVSALGLMQILAWGSTYYLLAVLAEPIASDTGWSLTWTVGALSLGMLISGFVAPRIGKIIDASGGRPVLVASAMIFALGLALLAASPNLVIFTLAWVILGVGMAAGLYDAAFSALARLYGDAARQPITALTLFGGLASTVCWPLTAYLEDQFGWRGTCLVYAGLHLFVACPIYLTLLPREAKTTRATVESTASGSAPSTPVFVILATAFAATAAITSVNSVHLLTFLQSHDITLAAAVALGALVGPAQVTARLVEMFAARYHHPIWTMAASVGFIAVGTSLLWIGAPPLALALMLYGAGIGLQSIARGTVPLTLFGAKDYPIVMGRLALPSRVAGAVAPIASAFMLESWGAQTTLVTLAAIALANVLVVALLFSLAKRV